MSPTFSLTLTRWVGTGLLLLLTLTGKAVAVSVLDRVQDLVVPRCITPVAGETFSRLHESGALQRSLGDEFALSNVSIRNDRIILEIKDRTERVTSMVLALPNAAQGESVGQGKHFLYQFEAGAERSPASAAALRAAATLFDEALPDSAIERCGGPPQSAGAGEPASPAETGRGSRTRAYLSAGLQWLILAVAVAYAMIVIGKDPRRRP